jgi:hypothetical protein
MSRNGSGTYSLPEAAFVYNTVISETAVNSNFSDIATAITASIAKDGQTTPTANLPMGTYRHTGVGNASARTDYAAAGQVADGALTWCGTAGGSKNALTLTPTPAITAYAAGQRFWFKAGSTQSDDAVTIAVSGLTAKAGEIDDAALSASVYIEANKYYIGFYDGTALQLTRLSQNLLGALVAADIGVTVQGYDADTSKLDVSETRSAAQNFADNTLQRPKILDYSETVNALGDLGGGTDDIDLESGNVVSATVSTAEQTFTFSNPPGTGIAGSFTLILTNGGSQTVNWPASVDWAGGNAPTLTASGVDVLTFVTLDAGTIWYGFAAGLDMQ